MEVEFRASCRKKRAEIVARIKQLQDPAQSLAEDAECRAEVESAYDADFEKLRLVRKVRALQIYTFQMQEQVLTSLIVIGRAYARTCVLLSSQLIFFTIILEC